jgi:hypothetical protein
MSVCVRSLPLNFSPEQIAELFWTQIGLSVDPEQMSVKNSGTYSATAYVQVTEDSLVSFLNRNFETVTLDDQDSAVNFAPIKWCGTSRPVTVALPGPVNKNGIRKL